MIKKPTFSQKFNKKILTHRKIRINFKTNLKLFFQNLFSNLCGGRCSCPCLDVKPHHKTKLQKLFDKGQSRITSEFDIMRITKQLMIFGSFYKKYLYDQKRHTFIKHCKHNVIKIDSDCSSDSHESCPSYSDHSSSHSDKNNDQNQSEFNTSSKKEISKNKRLSI